MAFIIWSAGAVTLLCIGVSCAKSDKAAGFFTFGEPPVIEDIKSYNKAVAKLWAVFAVIFEIIGIPFLYLKQNSPLVIPVIFAVLLWVILLIVFYLKIENKYRK